MPSTLKSSVVDCQPAPSAARIASLLCSPAAVLAGGDEIAGVCSGTVVLAVGAVASVMHRALSRIRNVVGPMAAAAPSAVGFQRTVALMVALA